MKMDNWGGKEGILELLVDPKLETATTTKGRQLTRGGEKYGGFGTGQGKTAGEVRAD